MWTSHLAAVRFYSDFPGCDTFVAFISSMNFSEQFGFIAVRKVSLLRNGNELCCTCMATNSDWSEGFEKISGVKRILRWFFLKELLHLTAVDVDYFNTRITERSLQLTQCHMQMRLFNAVVRIARFRFRKKNRWIRSKVLDPTRLLYSRVKCRHSAYF